MNSSSAVDLVNPPQVVRSGWGEPHLLAGAQMGGGARLARGTLYIRIPAVHSSRKSLLFIPQVFRLLYAPRDEAEVGVALRVLRASLLYAQS